MPGSEHNDAYRFDENGKLIKLTNHAGGIVGGISDGFPIVFRAAFKPTPSIHAVQNVLTGRAANVEVQVEGRHDPIIAPGGNSGGSDDSYYPGGLSFSANPVQNGLIKKAFR